MQILPQLEQKADLLVTDPPYKLTSGGKRKQVMGGIFAKKNYDNSGKLMDIIPWSEMAGPLFEACKDNADAYVMANDKNIFEAHRAFCNAGWKYHNLLAWDKGAPTRNRWYMKNLEFTLYLWKGRARTINEPGSKQLMSCPRPKLRFHSTQKPVRLMSYYIRNSSERGDLVLDPFAGSGSTLVAAMRHGRRAIGCECNPEWFEKSCERLYNEMRKPDMEEAL
jgi:site-specific DNA-methyltransferase (adenine-specific)